MVRVPWRVEAQGRVSNSINPGSRFGYSERTPATSAAASLSEPPQRRIGGVVATQPVNTGSRRRRLRTQVDTRHTGRVRVDRDPRAKDDLQPVVCAADDVAADVVGVVGL